MTKTILGAGFHERVAHADYHADPCAAPSLSSSVAKILVSQTPEMARRAHPRLNPNFTSGEDSKFDVGSAVHDWLASVGSRIQLILGFDDWRTKASQEARQQARAGGKVPLLDKQMAVVSGIATEIHRQFKNESIDLGMSETVVIAQDDGIWLRAMMDSFAPPWINDFKVTKINLANDAALARHIVDTGYDLRAAFYLRVAELALPELAGRLGFRWIFIEEAPPHGIRVIEADATFREMGRRKAEFAIKRWAECTASGVWPHLQGLPRTLSYPSFMENQWLEREAGDPAFAPADVLAAG